MYKSTCCNYSVIVSHGEEGTNYYECNKCHKPCDVKIQGITEQTKQKEIDCKFSSNGLLSRDMLKFEIYRNNKLIRLWFLVALFMFIIVCVFIYWSWNKIDDFVDDYSNEFSSYIDYPIRETVGQGIEIAKAEETILPNQIITTYSIDKNQTDNEPCITASGMDLCDYQFMGNNLIASTTTDKVICKGNHKPNFGQLLKGECGFPFSSVIANNFYPFGTKVEIDGVIYQVEDRMNSRYGKNNWDILVPDKETAINWGKKVLDIKIIK